MFTKPKPSEPSSSDKLLADLILDRQQRTERAGKAISEILRTERVAFKVMRLNLTDDGRMQPEVSIVALDLK